MYVFKYEVCFKTWINKNKKSASKQKNLIKWTIFPNMKI